MKLTGDLNRIMANFKYINATVSVSKFKNTRLYQVPLDSLYAKLTNIQVANREDDTIFVTVEFRSAEGGAPVLFVQKAAIPVGAALNVLTGDSINLTPGDRVNVWLVNNPDAANPEHPNADIFASITECYPEEEGSYGT